MAYPVGTCVLLEWDRQHAVGERFRRRREARDRARVREPNYVVRVRGIVVAPAGDSSLVVFFDSKRYNRKGFGLQLVHDKHLRRTRCRNVEIVHLRKLLEVQHHEEVAARLPLAAKRYLVGLHGYEIDAAIARHDRQTVESELIDLAKLGGALPIEQQVKIDQALEKLPQRGKQYLHRYPRVRIDGTHEYDHQDE